MRKASINLSIQYLSILFFLLITIDTLQAFQIAVKTPTINSANSENHIDEQQSIDRWKRDAAAIAETTERSQFIDAVFNIPIKTLMAVNNIVQKSRPVFRRIGEFAAKRFEEAIRPLSKQNGRTEVAPNPSYIVPADETQNPPQATAITL